MYDLALRPTVINGTMYRDDYAVIWRSDFGDRRVGRIVKSAGRDQWSWHLHPNAPVPAWGNGIAPRLEDATTQSRAAWEKYVATQRRHDWVPRLKVPDG